MRACRLRVLCFPNAGSAEDMFSSEGSGSRRVSSPLLVSVTLLCPLQKMPNDISPVLLRTDFFTMAFQHSSLCNGAERAVGRGQSALVL